MSYADRSYYASLGLEAEDEAALEAILERASDDVDALCYGRIRKAGFENLTAFQQEKVKKAVCYHAAFLSAYAEMLESPFASYGINGVSMSFSVEKIITQGGVKTNQTVMQQLRQSGLMSRLIC